MDPQKVMLFGVGFIFLTGITLFVSFKLQSKIITKKKLGVLIVQNNAKKTNGIITDGQIRRISEKKGNIDTLKVKDVMTKNPISVDKDI